MIPLDSEHRIKFSLPIYCDFVYLLRCLDEMLCMFFSSIIDSKVINNEGEGDGYGFVGLEYWGEFNRLVSVLLQVLFKYVMCNYSSLWKTIHSLLNIYIDFVSVFNVSEFILIDNPLDYDVKGQLNVFVTVHWCVEIKVCYF